MTICLLKYGHYDAGSCHLELFRNMACKRANLSAKATEGVCTDPGWGEELRSRGLSAVVPVASGGSGGPLARG